MVAVVEHQLGELLDDLRQLTVIAQAGVISRPPRRLEWGESRPAAVVYLDVVGFTALSTRLPSEVLTELIDRTFRILELAAQSEGGYCDQVVGDAALYVFPGHPNHPPPCEAAVRAGWEMLKRIEQINEVLPGEGLGVAVRVGVAYGEVTRTQVGSQRAGITVMGETVNVAQRLESAAEPNQLYTTVRVVERAGELVRAEKLGRRRLKGLGEVEIYRVVEVREPPVRLRGSFRRLTRMVGRERELDHLGRTLRDWLGRKGKFGGLVVIRGPAGAGKSRLALELVEALAGEVELAQGRVSLSEYGRLTEVARGIADLGGFSRHDLVGRWEELLSRAGGTGGLGDDYIQRARRHLRLLALLYEAPEVDYRGLLRADPQSFLLNCKLALRAVAELVSRTEGRPLLLLVDDLQWMGPEERELVSYLLSEAELATPLAVVGTARPEYRPGEGELGADEVELLELAPLGRSAGKELVAELLPGLELPQRLWEELHRRAEGLPYYYLEFGRMLLRRGLVREEGGRYRLAGEVEELALPDDLVALVLGRLDRLPEQLRRLVARASIWGESFTIDEMAELDRRLGLAEEAPLEEGLAELSRRGVLGREGERWRFEHALTREAAYRALLTPTRRALHRAAAEVLEERLVAGSAGEGDLRAELVRHLAGAGEPLRAHREQCALLVLWSNTGRWEGWREGTGLARSLWEEARRADPTLPDRSPWLLRAEGLQLWRRGETEQAERLMSEALSLSRQVGDRHIEGICLANLAVLQHDLGKPEKAEKFYLEAVELARKLGDRRSEGIRLGNLANLYRDLGSYEQAEKLYLEAVSIARELDDRRSVGIWRGNLAVLYRELGREEEAEKLHLEALAMARELGDRRDEGIWLGGLAVLALEGGNLSRAEGLFLEALNIARELGDRRLEGIWLGWLGALALESSNFSQACRFLREASSLLADTDRVEWITVQCQLVRALRALGREAESLSVYRQAEQAFSTLGASGNSRLARQIAAAREALDKSQGGAAAESC